MLKKTIKFTNFDGVETSMDAYFNLTKTECVDLNLEYEEDGGLIGRLKRMIAERKDKDFIPQKPAVDFVRLLVDRAYGVRPADDPNAFIKEDDNGVPMIRKFKRTLAYDAYVYGLLTGEYSLDEFATNAMPRVSEEQMAEAQKQMESEGLGELVKTPLKEV
jgi:hypothetical protein